MENLEFVTERQAIIDEMDEELLKGGVTLSEWCCAIVREADLAFVGEADLAAIVTAMAGVETYLRFEYGGGKRATFANLIKSAPLSSELKAELDIIRRYRNSWVHVQDPSDDADLQLNPEKYEQELSNFAFRAIRALRETIYDNQWV